MTFDEWIIALDAEFQRVGWGPPSYVCAAGPECWQGEYDAGLTPADAVSKELDASAS